MAWGRPPRVPPREVGERMGLKGPGGDERLAAAARQAIAVLTRLGKRLCLEPALRLGRDFLFITPEITVDANAALNVS